MIKPTSRYICLSVSKANKKYLDILDDYSLEFNLNKSASIFRIIDEYHHRRCIEALKR
jgi:hypothetical protein